MILDRRQLLLGASGSALAQRRKAQPALRPNILLVLADDLPAWMLGCYGNKEIRTPQIDTLARTGLRFLNSFVCTPICSASRATLFTGRTPRQHGIHDFLTAQPITDPPQGQAAPPASFAQEVMLSDLLSAQGYQCGYVGKWHLGEDQQPTHKFSYTYTMLGGSRSYRDPEMSLEGKLVQEEGYLTELMTGRACEFLDRQTATQPFFLTVGYLNPHTPYDNHPQRYYDMYANTAFDSVGWEPAAKNALREKNLLTDTVGNIRRAAAATTALDDQMPVLIRKLQERKLWDNTLIIFTADNGYLLGRHGLWSKGLASDPINMYDEVMQVPMIWSWPGKVPSEATAPELISFYDFLPTLCEVSGATVPTGRNMGGRSYLPVVMRDPLPKKEPWNNVVFGEFRNTLMARDKRYKLVSRNEGRGPNELFDLSTDPREKINQFDNPQFVTVRERLGAELSRWLARTAS